MQILEKIWNDIKQGENLDLYPLVIVAFTLAILNLLGIVSEPQIFSVILAALGFVAVSALVSRFKFDDLAYKIQAIQKGNQEQMRPLHEVVSRLGIPAEINFEPGESGTGKFYKRLIEYICSASEGDEILIMGQSRGGGEPKETVEYQNYREEYSKALLQKAKEPDITYRRIICFEDSPGEGKIQPGQVRQWIIDHSKEMLAIKKIKPGKVFLKKGKTLSRSDVFILKDKVASIVIDIRDPSTGLFHAEGGIIFYNPPNGQIIKKLYSLFMMTDDQSIAVKPEDFE